MNKKQRNILLILVIFLLSITIGVTIYLVFRKSDDKKKSLPKALRKAKSEESNLPDEDKEEKKKEIDDKETVNIKPTSEEIPQPISGYVDRETEEDPKQTTDGSDQTIISLHKPDDIKPQATYTSIISKETEMTGETTPAATILTDLITPTSEKEKPVLPELTPIPVIDITETPSYDAVSNQFKPQVEGKEPASSKEEDDKTLLEQLGFVDQIPTVFVPLPITELPPPLATSSPLLKRAESKFKEPETESTREPETESTIEPETESTREPETESTIEPETENPDQDPEDLSSPEMEVEVQEQVPVFPAVFRASGQDTVVVPKETPPPKEAMYEDQMYSTKRTAKSIIEKRRYKQPGLSNLPRFSTDYEEEANLKRKLGVKKSSLPVLDHFWNEICKEAKKECLWFPQYDPEEVISFQVEVYKFHICNKRLYEAGLEMTDFNPPLTKRMLKEWNNYDNFFEFTFPCTPRFHESDMVIVKTSSLNRFLLDSTVQMFKCHKWVQIKDNMNALVESLISYLSDKSVFGYLKAKFVCADVMIENEDLIENQGEIEIVNEPGAMAENQIIKDVAIVLRCCKLFGCYEALSNLRNFIITSMLDGIPTEHYTENFFLSIEREQSLFPDEYETEQKRIEKGKRD